MSIGKKAKHLLFAVISSLIMLFIGGALLGLAVFLYMRNGSDSAITVITTSVMASVVATIIMNIGVKYSNSVSAHKTISNRMIIAIRDLNSKNVATAPDKLFDAYLDMCYYSSMLVYKGDFRVLSECWDKAIDNLKCQKLELAQCESILTDAKNRFNRYSKTPPVAFTEEEKRIENNKDTNVINS